MELLRGESSMIKDVAAAVGMDDQLYFNKVFKKYYNVSPSEFKKAASGYRGISAHTLSYSVERV